MDGDNHKWHVAQYHRCMAELENIGDRLWCEGIKLQRNDSGSLDFFCTACADWYPNSAVSHWTQVLDTGTPEYNVTPHHKIAKHIKSVANMNLPGLDAAELRDDKVMRRRQTWLHAMAPDDDKFD